MVYSLPKIEENEGCAMGKHHRNSFPQGGAQRANETLELVHTDMCGPMSTTSLGGNKYFIFFNDDYTHMTWVYFMEQKFEVYGIFKKLKSLVENK